MEVVLAYIGPGAGFAVGTTILAVLAALLSGFAAMVLWPIRWALRTLRGRSAHARARVKRVVILGLDGMEPSLAERWMSEGKLPNLSKLRAQGTYTRLGTTCPPLSPVAWSSFLTGCNPGKHRIFDFLDRDPQRYTPVLSSVSIAPPRRQLRLGRRTVPLGRAQVRGLRKGAPFWNVLGEHGIFSSIVRVPITFPPEKFNGVLLSAMCVPDLRGTQGTFAHYRADDAPAEEFTGGEQLRLRHVGGDWHGDLLGPVDSTTSTTDPLTQPFTLRCDGADAARLRIGQERLSLSRGTYSPWVNVSFRTAIGIKVRGICQFLLLRSGDRPQLYVTPVQIDPQSPALPISHPATFSTYLAKTCGSYATLGLAEDTWGLNCGVLDDDAFLEQCNQADDERAEMFFDSLDKVRRGLCVCVFDGTDRIQHMFWRYLEDDHPARPKNANGAGARVVEEHYQRMDALVGRTMAECADRDTVLMVVSDHGFASFQRGIDLNRWLEDNGYLTFHEGRREQRYLAGVDWSKTTAYALGLAGLWLNVEGREAEGIVPPRDAAALRSEIAGKLAGLIDGARDTEAIARVFDAEKTYHGPYRADGPDLIVGYNRGYRVCWETAVGQGTGSVFHDNTKAWSGDHCIDPRQIPGVLFCNRRIAAEHPRLLDLGPTVLDLFGVKTPEHMDGHPLHVAEHA